MFHHPAQLRARAFPGSAGILAGEFRVPTRRQGCRRSLESASAARAPQPRPAGSAHPCYRRDPWFMWSLLWRFCVPLGVSWAAAVAVAQGSESAPRASSLPEYRVTRWTAESGLPQNAIKALVQTRDGYIWVGTLNGLA